MQETRPVLIVGAGPTGLTAAAELVRFRIPVRLVDKYKTPPNTSRALAVQSRTMELMHQRGLAGEMVRLGNRGLFTTLYSDGKLLGTVDLRQIDSRFNFTLLLAQSETERLLREHLERSGVYVERETELIAFSQGENSSAGVQITLRKSDGSLEEVDAAYLIDAEGAHSVVRHSMDLAFKGTSLPNSYALADLYIDGNLPEDQLSIFVPRSGLLAAFPMGSRRFRIIATEKENVRKDAPPPDLAYMHSAWTKGAHIPVRFRDLQWSSRFRINSRALDQLRHGGVFFGGDSAHIHSPAGGQGMNTGIQDMVNLGWKLALVYRGIAIDDLLDTYSEERLPIIHQLVATTERATDLFNSDSPFVHSLIQHALPLALRFQAIQRKGSNIVSELGAGYQKSSLNCEVIGGGTIQAGDRFPDVLLQNNASARMLDVLNPSTFTALSLRVDTPLDFPTLQRATSLITSQPAETPSLQLSEVLGAATVALVRPDGYLLCAGDSDHVSHQLRGWFGKWLPNMSA